jgi:hypothetical protein
VYLLWMFQKMFYGPNDNPENKKLRDLKPWEIAMCGTLVLFVFWGGFFPNTFLKPMEASATAARMMALNPAGSRPTWSDPTLDIDSKGQLVRTSDGQTQLVSPANLHFKFELPQEAAVTASAAVEGGH